MTRRHWWILVTVLSGLHLATLAVLIFYCVDQYYDRACPLDVFGKILSFPAVVLFPIAGTLSIPLIFANSCLWGLVFAAPYRAFKGWQLVSGDSQ
ncbi:MAG: hypothetical protein AAF593_02730 [Planctomycetota bacterium]